MKKIKFLFIVLTILISCNLFIPIVNAEEEEITTDQVEVEDYEAITEEESKQEILDLINEYLDEIGQKIDEIDEKIEETKNQKEFEYYPAVRLNIDTPLFGLSSVTESKLRVKKDISTSDVAEKYSIRDIVDNRTIRLPESYLGTIVMSTTEYNIDINMTLSQLKLTLAKCIQYSSQVDSVIEYVESQTNTIFKDYISDTKKSSISDVKTRVKKVSSQLADIADVISKLELLGIDVSEYTQTYETLSDELYQISVSSKNTLILDNDLNELVKSSLANESSVLDLNTQVTQEYNEALESVDYLSFLENLSKKYEQIVENMDKYIESGSKTQTDENGETTTTVYYQTTSVSTLDYIEEVLDDINNEIDMLKEEQENEAQEEADTDQTEENDETQEEQEKTDEEIEQEKQALIEENTKKIDEAYSKYTDVLSREYKFYTANINTLLKDSSDKVSDVIAQLTSDVVISNDIFDYIKYIYIDLPENMDTYIDENSVDSTIELENLITLLRKELKTLSTNDTKITKLYEDMVVELLAS